MEYEKLIGKRVKMPNWEFPLHIVSINGYKIEDKWEIFAEFPVQDVKIPLFKDFGFPATQPKELLSEALKYIFD